MYVKRILNEDKVVGFRVFDFCDDTSAKMDVDVETGQELAVVYQGSIKIKKESIPTKVVGDSYVTADEANVISPESWADAIPHISTKYLLGSAQYFEDSDVPSELEEIANKLLETGKNIKNLRLSCALNDCDRRDMMVEVRHDNIVPVLLFLSRVTGTDFGELLQFMYNRGYKLTRYDTSRESIAYDDGILFDPVFCPVFCGWSGDFLDGTGWMFYKSYANPDVELDIEEEE